MIRAGAASVDITPPSGLAMSGFVARTEPALGAHDPLTVRAIVVGDTALLVADVIGISAAMSARIRARCCLPDDNVVVTALHTHGGPVSMADRLSGGADADYLARLETACVQAIDQAVASAEPAQLSVGLGADPGVGRNRRHPNGITDTALPVLRIRRRDGSMIAVLIAYACHPVVLAADNRLWTADYPYYTRLALEAAYPGAIAVFAMGCIGDVNTGHSAHASITLQPNAQRSFATAERLGTAVAQAALTAGEQPMDGPVIARHVQLDLAFARRESLPLDQLARQWRAEAISADPIRAELLRCWAQWAETAPPEPLAHLPARVSLLDWAGVPIVALPGEIFASTATIIRGHWPRAPAFVVGFADDNPGYIPAGEEYGFGGYEVDQAHRYYGMPASFAPGSAEQLAQAAITLLDVMKTS